MDDATLSPQNSKRHPLIFQVLLDRDQTFCWDANTNDFRNRCLRVWSVRAACNKQRSIEVTTRYSGPIRFELCV